MHREHHGSIVASVAAISMAACVGVFGDDGVQSSTSSGADIGPTNANAAGAGQCAPPVLRSQRITKLEYNNVIRDLFQLPGDFSGNFSAPGEGKAGFSTESEAQGLSPTIVSDFWTASGAVASALFASNSTTLLTCSEGEACARTILTRLTTRAFRRPATSAELDALVNIFKGSSSQVFADAMQLAVRAVLVSPQFIFRTYEMTANGSTEIALDDYELASRVSFGLWGSIPDDPLLEDAAKGRMREGAVLEAHVRRMLKDSRASYLAHSFVPQWLDLERFDSFALQGDLFPAWNPTLKASMRMETQAFFEHLIADDRNVMDVLSANYTYVDGTLGAFYGLPMGPSTELAKVSLDADRQGILTHASILAMNSLGYRTSPTKRGKWIQERILCEPVGSPPPDVPALPPASAGDPEDESQIRQRLQAHRQRPDCNACHSVLDPVGFAFENFDSSGAFRTQYRNGLPVDASGQLSTGQQLHGYKDLAALLQSDDRFPACVASKLSSFAQGVSVTPVADECFVKRLTASMRTAPRFSDLVVAIVTDPSFRNRRASQ